MNITDIMIARALTPEVQAAQAAVTAQAAANEAISAAEQVAQSIHFGAENAGKIIIVGNDGTINFSNLTEEETCRI